MGGENGDSGNGLGGWMEELAEGLTGLIGKRVAGIAATPYSVDVVFDDCTTLTIHMEPQTAISLDELDEDECRCLKKCIGRHGLASEETQDCMDECIEELES